MQESTYNFEDNLKNVVYTSDKLVNNMLQSVQDEIERIDSRVLEPSCGDGNFLDAILRKKLFRVCKKYGHSRVDFEFYILRALMSLYGVEIDNSVVILCKQRLELSVKQFYLKYYTEKQWIVLLPLVQYILDTNILCGDSLSLTSPIDGSPVVLAEWSFLGSYKVKRRDFVYEQLIDVSESAEKVLDILKALFQSP